MTSPPERSALRLATGSAPSLRSTPKRTCPGISAGNNLVVIAARDEAELLELMRSAEGLDVICSHFVEPDFDNQTTAIALYGPDAQRLTSSLPLALRQPRAA